MQVTQNAYEKPFTAPSVQNASLSTETENNTRLVSNVVQENLKHIVTSPKTPTEARSFSHVEKTTKETQKTIKAAMEMADECIKTIHSIIEKSQHDIDAVDAKTLNITAS